MKPLIKWSGGKSKELPIVHKYKPKEFNTYHEPFIGGGAAWLNLNHSKNVVSDNFAELVEFYNIIKEYDLIKFHDDIFISYYFNINNHYVHKIPYDNGWVSNRKITVSSEVDALHNLDNNYNRKFLDKEVPHILKKLNKEGKIDNIKNNL